MARVVVGLGHLPPYWPTATRMPLQDGVCRQWHRMKIYMSSYLLSFDCERLADDQGSRAPNVYSGRALRLVVACALV